VIASLLSLALAAAATSPTVQDDNRHVPVLVKFTGPVSSVTYELGDAGSLTVHLDLESSAESRSLRLPFPVDPLGRTPEIRVDPESSESTSGAEVLRDNRRPGWNRLAVAVRTVPPPPDGTAKLGTSGAVALIATFLLLVSLRRFPAIVLVPLACGGALLATSLHEQARTREANQVRVFEGQGDGGEWVRVDVGSGELDLEPEPSGTLDVTPTGAAVHWTVTSSATAPSDTWTVRGGERLVRRTPASPGTLTRESNGLGNLAETWLRSPEGTWARHGPWKQGGPLPNRNEGTPIVPEAESTDPPGWLAAALPQGVPVLVARLAPGQPLTRSVGPSQAQDPDDPSGPRRGARRADPVTWVRVVDFR
tara:strand:- start:11869 stop:12963 length:1095 start_codon:yes stop_codon:yes gene_type:complete